LSTKIRAWAIVFSRKQNFAHTITFSQNWKADFNAPCPKDVKYPRIQAISEGMQEQCHYLLDLFGFIDLTCL